MENLARKINLFAAGDKQERDIAVGSAENAVSNVWWQDWVARWWYGWEAGERPEHQEGAQMPGRKRAAQDPSIACPPARFRAAAQGGEPAETDKITKSALGPTICATLQEAAADFVAAL
jgi:hypothetical protein